MIYAGVDVGSCNTKVVLIDSHRRLLGWSVCRSGTDFAATADLSLGEALERAGLDQGLPLRMVATGYGRKNVSCRDGDKTEISCHARGCFHFYPQPLAVVDIGGQDNKVIKLDDQGRRLDFKLNRKCAAGTGAFLDEMTRRLDLAPTDLDGLARQSTAMVELGSYCTVFTATEVLDKIRQGAKVSDIVKGLYFSVIKRIMEMDLLTEQVVMTGGVVAFNPYLVTMFEERLRRPVLVPPNPQLTGAWGAALFAIDL